MLAISPAEVGTVHVAATRPVGGASGEMENHAVLRRHLRVYGPRFFWADPMQAGVGKYWEMLKSGPLEVQKWALLDAAMG